MNSLLTCPLAWQQFYSMNKGLFRANPLHKFCSSVNTAHQVVYQFFCVLEYRLVLEMPAHLTTNHKGCNSRGWNLSEDVTDGTGGSLLVVASTTCPWALEVRGHVVDTPTNRVGCISHPFTEIGGLTQARLTLPNRGAWSQDVEGRLQTGHSTFIMRSCNTLPDSMGC